MNTQALSPSQQSIVAISAFTANGVLEKLQSALHEGLDAGLTVNEIKEILVQLYAYAGFPRSLNAIQTFMAVMEERQAKGVEDEAGKDASPVPPDMDRNEYGARVRARLAGLDDIPEPTGFQLFAPVIDQFLKEHLFADIFARDNLDYRFPRWRRGSRARVSRFGRNTTRSKAIRLWAWWRSSGQWMENPGDSENEYMANRRSSQNC